MKTSENSSKAKALFQRCFDTTLFCCCSVAQQCLTLCDSMDSSLPGSCVQGIFQARTLEWVAIFFPQGSSWTKDWIHVSCIGRQILDHWGTREALRVKNFKKKHSFQSPLLYNYSILSHWIISHFSIMKAHLNLTGSIIKGMHFSL